MEFYIGIDDTDNKESRGTGHLARMIAEKLSANLQVNGILRHQLLFDPRVPYTAKNSCAAILLSSDNSPDLKSIFDQVETMMMSDFNPGSDPGLCVTATVPQAVTDFGKLAQRDLVKQSDARQLAKEHQILLKGLGGTQDGVIGALSAVGLAASGHDGRYVEIGKIRDLSGLVSVEKILEAGVNSVRTMDEKPVNGGLVMTDKMRPARRFGQPILYVQPENDYWQPLKLD